MKIATVIILLLLSSQIFSQTAEEVRLSKVVSELIDNDEYEKALPILHELVKLNDYNTIYRYNRAVAFFNLKQYTSAMADYKILSASIPEESEYVFQIGNAYEQLDSAQQAIQYYTNAIALEADNFLYYFKRGTVYLKLTSYRKAETDFNDALAINPNHDNSLHNRGIALYKLGKPTKACQDWCKAHELGNRYSAIHIRKNCHTTNPCSR